MKPNYEDLGEFFAELEYHGGWDGPGGYLDRFSAHPPEGRAVEMSCYDKLMEAQHRPTRETAEYITKRRQLGDLDDLLRRAGR
jgi:hypothetical protein